MIDLPKDDFDSILATPTTPADQRKQPPASYANRNTFEEGCTKCRGTGRFTSWSGRQLGPCFACKGAGKKTFKSSTADRAKAKVQREERKINVTLSNIETWMADHPAEHAHLLAENSDFARSLLAGVAKFGSLTEKQLLAVQASMLRKADRAAQAQARVTNAPTVNATKLEQAFEIARSKADRPGARGIYVKPLRLKSGEISLQFTPGSAGSKWEGMLFAKTAGGHKLGYIKDGKLVTSYGCTDAEKAAMLDCAENPAIAAVAYGKAWSVCGVCARPLHNDESIAIGIGPICRQRFGW